MPIPLIAEIVPKAAGFALLDDANLRGSFRIVNNLTERNAIATDFRKSGMLVWVISTDVMYQLQPDLTTWQANSAATTSLQAAYNQGAQIITQTAIPVSLKGIDITEIFQILDSNNNPILSITGDGNIDSSDTITGNTFTTNIQKIALNNTPSDIIDTTSLTEYRAVQYFYTCHNSDQSGYETGQIFLVHDSNSVTICSYLNANIGTPCNIGFGATLDGLNNMCLTTSTDDSGFSRVLHLFKVALS